MASTISCLTQIAIVGLGKIAVDQHVPSIARSPAFHLAATVSRNAHAEGVDAFEDLSAMLAARPGITAIALCVPPQVRFALAREALLAGRDVLLEKPPGASLAEVAILSELAAAHGRAGPRPRRAGRRRVCPQELTEPPVRGAWRPVGR